MATGHTSRLRGLISSAAIALTSDDESDEFESILNNTRRCFRPKTSKGRRALPFCSRKTFLLRKANSDFFPIKGECDHLTTIGLGYSKDNAKYGLHWTLDEIEHYVCSLYPTIPLDLVGFKIGRMDRSKKISLLMDLKDGQDLKRQLMQSQVVIIPNRDLPLPVSAELNQSIRTRHRTQVSIPDRADSAATANTGQSSLSISHTHRRPNNLNTDVLAERHNQQLNNYMEIIDQGHFEDFQYGQVTENDSSLIDISFNVDNEDQTELLIEIDRQDVVNQLLQIYDAENNILHKTIKVHFQNEEGDDFGGLTKELFSIFWDGCKDKFFHGDSLYVPHLELHRKNKDIKKFTTLGKILTHMMILTKTLPNFISRSTYLLVGNPDFQVPKETIKEDFMYFITYGERELLKKAETSFNSLEPYERTLLEEFFTTNNFFDNPKKEEIADQLQTIAESIIVSKTIDFVKAIKDGIPLLFEEFWSTLTLEKLNKILAYQSPTPNKVIQCLKTDVDDLTSSQSSALYYLKTYIRNLRKEELSRFLYFVTGSCNMPQYIQISFSSISGACRRPVVHTCSNTLELPSTYNGFQDLSHEFNSVLNNDMSFQYTQV